MYKAVIFDFDYTLGDSTNGIVQSANYALTKLGYEKFSFDAIKRTIGLSLKNTYIALTNDETTDNAERFAVYFKEQADFVMVDCTELYSDVINILEGIREMGVATGIVTTKFHRRIDSILSKFNANGLIDVIVGAEDVMVEKPNPEGLLYAIDKLGIDKSEVLYVGDSFVDAEAAQNAEIDFAGVLTGTTSRTEFERYPYVLVEENINAIYKKLTERVI